MKTVQGGLLVVTLVSLGLAGCKKAEPMNAPAPLPTTEAPAAAPTAPAAAAPAQASGVTGGKVLETMRSGGYTYARLAANGAEVWVAGPETTLAVGDQVSVTGGTLMRDFTSNTLERTFPEIYFVATLSTGSPGAAPAVNPHGAAPPAVAAAKVEPAPGGTRVADVFANKASLSGKPVTVRGKVVKFNAGIMGRNWIHLQDGSGGAGTNDLTVTTDATAAVGDVVTVSGVVATDRDFGAGYTYAVLVEGATVEAK